MVTKRVIAKLSLIAGIMLTAALSQAFYNPDILISRAINSPEFTVKYSGAAAAMVELRVNGTSTGTQTVSPSKTAGSVSFTLDLLSLNDGENEVEVRLFDRNGKLLESKKISVSTDNGESSAVKLQGLKSGGTVQGPVEIKVGFGREMKSAYVSFFVDEQFKAMTNSSPYNFWWDTSNETNGWHDIQAWVVDENSVTLKTRKLRVFVNNPGGRTERQIPIVTTPTPKITKPPVAKAIAKPIAKPVNTTAIKNGVVAAKTNSVSKTTGPIELSTAANAISAVTSNAYGLKSSGQTTPLTGSAKIVTPKITKTLPRKLENVTAPKISNASNANNAVNIVKIGQGTRLPNIATFGVVFNSKVVNFDVKPRVENGVPLAPLRHLIEADGGKVNWENLTKTLFGEHDGKKIVVKIGDKIAKVDELDVVLEAIPYLEGGRTIVPITFIKDALQVEIEYDRKTGHVLITSTKKK